MNIRPIKRVFLQQPSVILIILMACYVSKDAFYNMLARAELGKSDVWVSHPSSLLCCSAIRASGGEASPLLVF